MFDLLELLKHEMVGKSFKLRSIKGNKARYLYHDADAEQDVIAVLYFDADIFDTTVLQDKMNFSELVDLHYFSGCARLRCEVRQL